ncbi:hypothetical protein GVAV_003358 [Gurleya vavrai]
METEEINKTNTRKDQCKSIIIGIKPSKMLPRGFKNKSIQKMAQELSKKFIDKASVFAEKMDGGEFIILVFDLDRGSEIRYKRLETKDLQVSDKNFYNRDGNRSIWDSSAEKLEITPSEFSVEAMKENVFYFTNSSFSNNEINENTQKDDNPIEILFGLDRQFYTIELPLYLFVKKREIENVLLYISKKYYCYAKLIISFSIQIVFNTNLENSQFVREEIIQLIESFIGKNFQCYEGYLILSECIKTKIGVYFISKINCNKVILCSDNFKDIKEYFKDTILKENAVFDSVKFSYALFYNRIEIENILCGNECYLTYEITMEDKINVTFIGFCSFKIKKCVKDIRLLLQQILKLSYWHFLYKNGSICAFTLENLSNNIKSFLTIGMYDEIKQMLENDTNKYCVEMEIDSELEDFICGKKNGKINKICKDFDCEVQVENKIENREKLIVVQMTGPGQKLYETLVMLENEYPAEISFFLHEKHHRRIIGFGGKNIQRIMKKYGVYIKFMGEEEKNFNGLNGNVIVKTPKRNFENLEKMKEEVLTLAEEPYLKSNKEKTLLSLFLYYSNFYANSMIFYNNVLTQIDKGMIPRIYLIKDSDITMLENDPENKIIKFDDSNYIFCLSFKQYNYKIVSSENWYETKLDSSKILENIFSKDKIALKSTDEKEENKKIEINKKHPEINNQLDDNTIGNRRGDQRHMK